MAASPDITLPPGFENMSRREQIEYLHRLWSYVSPKAEELPVPQWQIEAAEQAWQRHQADPNTAVSASESMARLRHMVTEQGAGE